MDDFQVMSDTLEDDVIVISAIYRQTKVVDRSNMTAKQAGTACQYILSRSVRSLEQSMKKLQNGPLRAKTTYLVVTEV